MKKKIALFLFSVLFALPVFSQDMTREQKRLIKRITRIADNLVDIGKTDMAIEKYNELLSIDSTNAELYFKIGYCYLNEQFENEQAIPHLKKAIRLQPDSIKNKQLPIEVYFYLGQAYRINYQFGKALQTFSELKQKAPKDPLFINDIEREMELCRNGMDLMKNKIDIKLENLGKTVNSRFKDHSPVISADESVLIFTSKREGSIDFDGQYFEDIYISYNENGQWLAPEKIGGNINTTGHEASIGISADGQKLLIFKDDKGDGNIYISYLHGYNWSKPERLPESINSATKETHASLSANENSLYFTSEREGGYGGKDIYIVRKLPNGKWSLAENIGPTINTPQDEEGSFIHPDGVTLYFSSKGHKTMGGFDIFYSKVDEEGEWSTPVNIGYPINTTGDDLFYVMTPNGTRAYYASQKEDGYGETDIYRIELLEEEEKEISIVKGELTFSETILDDIVINIKDSQTDETVGIFRPNTKTGKFLFVLNRGYTYYVDYKYKEDIVFSTNLPLEKEAPYIIDLPDTLTVSSEKLCDGIWYEKECYSREIEYVPIRFESRKAKKIKTNETLDKLACFLSNTPGAIIEVSGYTDSQGDDSTNLKLSKKRAEVVEEYLLRKKVNPNQLIVKGYGESKPIAMNNKPDNTPNYKASYYNRRVELKIVKQGKSKLLLRTIDDVPDEYKIIK